jgi:2-methylcitrate dehydratase PrpD
MTTVAHTQVPWLFAEWSRARTDTPLAPELVRAVQSRLLDFSANVVGGAATPASLRLQPLASTSAGPVHVPGGSRASAEAAALLYAVAAHALECDDTHQPSSTHPGAVVFATALPHAVATGASFDELAQAVVVGYEIMCRIGEAAGPFEQYARGFHPTGTCGAFGAAATAAVLLGLELEQIAAALGLAASVASGSMSFLEGGGSSKLLNAGHAASAGLMVARLAALGLEGPNEAITGPHGFLAGHSDAREVALPAVSGETLAIERTSVKAHGCCRYEQGPIDAILALRTETGLRPEDVERVEIGMLAAGWGIVAEPEEEKRRPRNVVESQFSMPFGAALAIVRGSAAPADHTDANLVDPQIQQLMDVVECYRDPTLDAQYPERWPAHVRIVLRGGDVLERAVTFPKGDPENPLSDDELLGKLGALAPAVDADSVAALGALIRGQAPPSSVVDQYASMWRAVCAGEAS